MAKISSLPLTFHEQDCMIHLDVERHSYDIYLYYLLEYHITWTENI